MTEVERRTYVVDQIRHLVSPYQRVSNWGYQGVAVLGILMTATGFILALIGPAVSALYPFICAAGGGQMMAYFQHIRFARRIDHLLKVLDGSICRCGYNLRGNTSGRCPECGVDVTPPAPPSSP